ncbi:MAG: GAF domain-containing sensor histidine kinase [Nitrosopumilus sp.]|nr:GAF domain-containing sensor histidine kinase [Nitrosopumilus sp.]
MEAPYPENENKRIKSLQSLNILDTPPEEKFDRITKIAQIIFDVPIALVSLVDSNRQWFKSCAGLSATETPRSMSFCAHAILKDDILLIEDATKDDRVKDNPLVTNEPFIRFYAGKPVLGPDGQKLGTLCIIDRQSRKLSRADKSIFSVLANWVDTEFKTISLTNQLKETTSKLLVAEEILREQNSNLEIEVKSKTDQLLKSEKMLTIGTMASRLAHDLKNPLFKIDLSSEILMKKYVNDMDEQMKTNYTVLKNSINSMSRIIKDTLDYVRTSQLNSSKYSLLNILNESLNNQNVPKSIEIVLPEKDYEVNCDGKKIEALISNILSNAIQAIEDSGKIDIKVKDENTKYLIKIIDSGPGIPEDILPKIFEPLFSSKSYGTGLGLGICKSIIEQHYGKIYASNNPTTFTIELPKMPIPENKQLTT